MKVLGRLVASVVITFAIAVASARSAADSPTSLIPGGLQTIYAPIAGLPEFANWQLAVVNRSSNPMPVSITIYSREGTPISPATTITLAGNESRNVDVKSDASARAWRYFGQFYRSIDGRRRASYDKRVSRSWQC